jgi:hypothetical protein
LPGLIGPQDRYNETAGPTGLPVQNGAIGSPGKWCIRREAELGVVGFGPTIIYVSNLSLNFFI